jgi:hypothetical protein
MQTELCPYQARAELLHLQPKQGGVASEER